MIEAKGSNQDLDNIFLGQANELVYGDFELEHIIIEGKKRFKRNLEAIQI